VRTQTRRETARARHGRFDGNIGMRYDLTTRKPAPAHLAACNVGARGTLFHELDAVDLLQLWLARARGKGISAATLAPAGTGCSGDATACTNSDRDRSTRGRSGMLVSADEARPRLTAEGRLRPPRRKP
jgi:hypothetical protein